MGLLSYLEDFNETLNAGLSRRGARSLVLGVRESTASNYARALRQLKEYASSRGEVLWRPSSTLFSNFVADRGVSPSGAHSAASALRWLFVSCGMTPPVPLTLRQAVSYAFARARDCGALHTKPALSFLHAWRTARSLAMETVTEMDCLQDAPNATAKQFRVARDICIVLVVLYAWLRVSDVSRVVFSSLVIDDDAVSFRAMMTKSERLHKQAGPMTPTMVLGAVRDEPHMCPVRWHRCYMSLRESAGVNSTWMYCQTDGTQLRPTTVAFVLKRFLSRMPPGTAEGATPHSLRGSGASAALDIGVTLDDVLRQGRWFKAATFLKHYDRRGMVGIQRAPDEVCTMRQFSSRLAATVREVFE